MICKCKEVVSNKGSEHEVFIPEPICCGIMNKIKKCVFNGYWVHSRTYNYCISNLDCGYLEQNPGMIVSEM